MAANATITLNDSTAVRLDSTDLEDRAEVVYIRNASAAIYIGDADVDATDGWPYSDTDDPMAFAVPYGGLWAIAATGTPTVKVMRA